MRIWLLLAILALAAPAAAQPPAGKPAGEERRQLVEGIVRTYPSMPAALVEELADRRRQLAGDASCELLDWFAKAGELAPAGAVVIGRREIDDCALPVLGLSIEAARDRLAARPIAMEVHGGEVTVLVRSSDPSPRVCCSMQHRLRRLADSDLWGGRWVLPDLQRAMLRLWIDDGGAVESEEYRGPRAPPKPARLEASQLRGRILEREVPSRALGETRRVSVYLPPGWSAARTWPAVFLADNATRGYAPMVEAMIRSGRIEPVILVGLGAGEAGVVGTAPHGFEQGLRFAEYVSPDDSLLGGDRFARHMRFVTEEVTAYVTREFSVSRRPRDRAIAGFSNGADFALRAGLMHPEVFAMAVPMSPAMTVVREADLKPGARARFWISGGLYEPAFLRTARTAEWSLERAGYTVESLYPAAGHDPLQWDVVLHEALLDMFPAGRASARRPQPS